MTSSWITDFGETLTILETCMVSGSGFSAIIERALRSSASPLASVAITVEASDGDALELGRAGKGEPDHVTAVLLSGRRHPRARARFWFHNPQEAADPVGTARVVGVVRQAFEAWWTPGARSPKGDLPMWTESTRRRGQGALELQSRTGQPFSVVFCDLDNFGSVNKKLGQAHGDAVIGRMAAFFERVVGDEAVVVHHGGDEFVFVLPESAHDQTLDLAARVIRAAAGYDFGAGEVPVGLSLGIASRSEYPSARFDELVRVADEQALKLLVKADATVKGSVRIAGQTVVPTDWSREVDPAIVNLVVRSSLGQPDTTPVFASPWLNALVRAGRRGLSTATGIAAAGSEILSTLTAFKIELGSTDVSFLPAKAASIVSPCISAFDVAVAFARVVLEAWWRAPATAQEFRIMIGQLGTMTTVTVGGEVQLRISGPCHGQRDIDLGGPWTAETVGASPEVAATGHIVTTASPFILMEIGRNHLRTLPFMAADHIVIDDRPGRGGGLPDFWELSLSRLFSSMGRLPNVKRVVVVGEIANARRTVAMLHDPDTWDTDYLSYKTSVPKPLVERAQRRLRGVAQHFGNEEDAIEALVEVSRASAVLQALDVATQVEPKALLRRTLDFPRAALGPADGCRVRTAAEAYPLVLELLRAEGNADEFIKDQDGMLLRELVDFKVVVEDPARDQTPWFFRNEEDDLRSYYDEQFVKDEGKFASKLRVSGHEDAILKHVRWALSPRDGHSFATRRAMLVVPHEPHPHPEQVSPLGLVSIRVLPRLSRGGAVMNFSFTWRTVEALIGFPYSLYGSLRYSQHLCERLQQLAPEHPISLGFVSYVAHSLHFFVSDESRRIARSIVGDSST